MSYSFHTYDRGRKCKFCQTPIADQAHGLQEYCEREVLEDGSVKSCKDDYNAWLRKAGDQPYLDAMAFQKRMTAALSALYGAMGAKVTLEQLNQYGIQLQRAQKMEFQNELPLFYFIHFRIEQLTPFTFKITKHVSVL
ncbi:MAG: hypothetical protein EOP48_02530 [Sphingobacteriales bacterium]|nr:MAG: hypothetical protein EOP48_02530 [Sphingobacteriales bacterium]